MALKANILVQVRESHVHFPMEGRDSLKVWQGEVLILPEQIPGFVTFKVIKSDCQPEYPFEGDCWKGRTYTVKREYLANVSDLVIQFTTDGHCKSCGAPVREGESKCEYCGVLYGGS